MAKKTPKKKPQRARAGNPKLFVAEYLIDHNATQAAIRCGYSKASARNTGSKLVTKYDTKIQSAIAESNARTEVTADNVQEELGRLAFADITDIIEFGPGATYRVKDSRTLSRDVTSAICSVKFTPGKFGDTVSFTMHKKAQALEMLAKRLGMLVERHEVQTGESKVLVYLPDNDRSVQGVDRADEEGV